MQFQFWRRSTRADDDPNHVAGLGESYPLFPNRVSGKGQMKNERQVESKEKRPIRKARFFALLGIVLAATFMGEFLGGVLSCKIHDRIVD